MQGSHPRIGPIVFSRAEMSLFHPAIEGYPFAFPIFVDPIFLHLCEDKHGKLFKSKCKKYFSIWIWDFNLNHIFYIFHAKRESNHAETRAEAILYWTYNTSKKVLSRPEMQTKWILSISWPGNTIALSYSDGQPINDQSTSLISRLNFQLEAFRRRLHGHQEPVGIDRP